LEKLYDDFREKGIAIKEMQEFLEVKGKKVEISEHGNYILGTLDGIDFVASGTIQETGKPYSASLRLKFIMKTKVIKTLNGVDMPITKAMSQTVKLLCSDDKLVHLVQKYNQLVGKDLFIKYICKDEEVLTIQDEQGILEIK
jgi:hypothetical protein